MIDTDKIMRTTKILLHGRHINKNEADDYLHLLAEVKELRRLLRQVADEYTDADGITYEIYCEFGDEEE